jgi:hypothetical protein
MRGSQAARVQCLEAACYRARPQRRPGPRRLADSLEIIPGAEVLELEQIAKESARTVADDDSVRLGDPLQARREVRRLANDTAFLRVSRANEVADNDQPGRNSNTGLQGNVRRKRGHRCDQLEACLYGSLCVVLMGAGITKIREDTITHISRHEPVETVHGVGNAFLIGRNDLAQVLGVHARRE